MAVNVMKTKKNLGTVNLIEQAVLQSMPMIKKIRNFFCAKRYKVDSTVYLCTGDNICLYRLPECTLI